MEAKSPLKGEEKSRSTRLVHLDRKEELRKKKIYWILRRGQDIFFSALALLVLWPLMLILALIIWIDDPHGSPVFSQLRCGRDGKLFKMYKFRSMYLDAEARKAELMKENRISDGMMFKLEFDPRIIGCE